MAHYLGEILLVPYNFVPKECLRCDGRLLSIASHVALFSLLGTTFGGDGLTKFALPNYDPAAPRGSKYVIVAEGTFPRAT